MKKFVATLALVVATAAVAHAAPAKAIAAPSKPATLKGEIVDTGCYLSHGARGEKHKGCATKCVANGMPMGLLTSDGTLYLLTMSHDDADPYNKAKDMVSQMVEVTGTMMSRSGMKAIEVASVKPAATASR